MEGQVFNPVHRRSTGRHPLTRRFLAVLAVALIASLGLVARAGAFSFDTSATFVFDGDVNDIAAGDLNGDGRDDIIFRDADGTLSAWFMNGFAFAAPAATIGHAPVDYAIAEHHFDLI